jgi:hypothetical protein
MISAASTYFIRAPFGSDPSQRQAAKRETASQAKQQLGDYGSHSSHLSSLVNESEHNNAVVCLPVSSYYSVQ